ncbi:MAG: hypothetical protein HN705_10770, partial [Rhodospirillales bacterium]|nr:hypothetical protein [Rhodospirillales bacterium]
MRLKFYQFFGVLFIALILAGSASAAGTSLAPTPKAATSAAEEAGVSVKDLEDLAGTLKDEAKRKALLARIQALIAVQKGTEKPAEKSSPGAAFIGMLTNHVEKMTGQLLSMAEALSDLPELKNWLIDQITSEKARDLWIGLLIKVGIALGVGIGGEYLTRWLLTRPRRAVASWKIKSYLMRIPALGARTLLDIIPIAVFAAMAYATLPLTEPDPKVNVVALIIINAYAIARVIMALVRMVLVPSNETLRLLPLGGETANYLFIWARRLVYTTVYGYFFAEASLLLGLPPAGHTGLLRLLGLLIAGMVIVLINQNRTDVAKLIRGKPKDDEQLAQIRNLRTRLAKSWHVLASLYVAVVFGVWAFGVLGGFQFLLKATIITGVILFAARY